MWSARHRITRWRARTSHVHACRSRGDSVSSACPRCAGFRRSSLGSRVSRHVDGAKAHRAPFACVGEGSRPRPLARAYEAAAQCTARPLAACRAESRVAATRFRNGARTRPGELLEHAPGVRPIRSIKVAALTRTARTHATRAARTCPHMAANDDRNPGVTNTRMSCSAPSV